MLQQCLFSRFTHKNACTGEKLTELIDIGAHNYVLCSRTIKKSIASSYSNYSRYNLPAGNILQYKWNAHLWSSQFHLEMQSSYTIYFFHTLRLITILSHAIPWEITYYGNENRWYSRIFIFFYHYSEHFFKSNISENLELFKRMPKLCRLYNIKVSWFDFI